MHQALWQRLRIHETDRLVVGVVGNIRHLGPEVAAIATPALAGLIASAIPARRAARMDPLAALRQE